MVLTALLTVDLAVFGFFTGGVFVLLGFLKNEKKVFMPKTITTHVINITKREINPKKGEVAVITHLFYILTIKKHRFL